MSAGLMATLWASYRERVLDANAGEVQVKETRRAFYAGAAALLQSMAADPDSDPDAFMERLHNELVQFWNDAKEGRA